jgi:hypothetical protein
MLKFTCPNCQSHDLFVSYNAKTQAPVKFDSMGPLYHSSRIVIDSEIFDYYFCENCGYVLENIKNMVQLREFLEEQSKSKKPPFNGTIVVRPNAPDDTTYRFLVEYYNLNNPTEVDYAELINFHEELTQLLFQYPNATVKFNTNP